MQVSLCRSLVRGLARTSSTPAANGRILSTWSTMDLVEHDMTSSGSTLQSTLQHTSGATVATPPLVWSSSSSSYSSSAAPAEEFSSPVAHELTLAQAAQHQDLFDKILLVFCPDTQGTNGDAPLQGRGIGQALTLARRTAPYANLLPQAVVVAPQLATLQTAMLTWPTRTPLEYVPWLCHPDLCLDLQHVPQIETNVEGVDCSLCHDSVQRNNNMHPADRWVAWMQDRPEQVLAVGASASVLAEIAVSLQCDTQWSQGSLKALGLRYE